jgi:hypothetical protein
MHRNTSKKLTFGNNITLYYAMDTHSKIAFESELIDMFNELWLVRILHDLYYNFLLDESNVMPGMMFKLYYTNVDGSEANLSQHLAENDELKICCADFLKWIGEPHVVTRVKRNRAFISAEIFFQPFWLGDGAWNDTWQIIKRKQNYYFSYSNLTTIYSAKNYIAIQMRSC